MTWVRNDFLFLLLSAIYGGSLYGSLGGKEEHHFYLEKSRLMTISDYTILICIIIYIYIPKYTSK